MGLDWHSSIRMTQQEREDYVRRYYAAELFSGENLLDLVERFAPKSTKPCQFVGANRMRELPNFNERAKEYLDARKKQAEEELTANPKFRNQDFIDHWQNQTLEKLKIEMGDKYICDGCPFLKSLQGADSTDSPFIGLTTSSCDFRGKRISADGVLGDICHEAFRDQNPQEMLDFADRLEKLLEELRASGDLEKEPYEKYLEESNDNPWVGPLTEAEYNEEPHWRERNIREAVHWLRTSAGYGVYMTTSY